MGKEHMIFDSYTTSVRLARAEVRIAQNLNIGLSKAFRIGLKLLVDLELEKGKKIVDPEILEEWKNLQEAEIQEISNYLNVEKKRHKTLDTVLERHKQEERIRNGNLIEVWDRGEERYITIPASSFDPEWHIPKREIKA